jgi:hypothetical protein
MSVLPLVWVWGYANADVIFEDFEAGVDSWVVENFGPGDTAGSTLSAVSSPAIEGIYSGDLYYKFNSAGDDIVVFIKELSAPVDTTAEPFLSMSIYGDGLNHGYMIEYYDLDTGAYAYNGSYFIYGQHWGNVINWTGWKTLVIPLVTYRFDRLNFFINDSPDSFTGESHIYLDDIKFIPSRLVLSAGWNMIGPGGDAPVDWGSCSVYNTYNAEIKTIADAQAAGWISGTIYYFDTSSQSYKQTPGEDSNLQWYRGYWLYSNLDNLSLRIPILRQ